jgi:hypothetical protein
MWEDVSDQRRPDLLWPVRFVRTGVGTRLPVIPENVRWRRRFLCEDSYKPGLYPQPGLELRFDTNLVN